MQPLQLRASQRGSCDLEPCRAKGGSYGKRSGEAALSQAVALNRICNAMRIRRKEKVDSGRRGEICGLELSQAKLGGKTRPNVAP